MLQNIVTYLIILLTCLVVIKKLFRYFKMNKGNNHISEPVIQNKCDSCKEDCIFTNIK